MENYVKTCIAVRPHHVGQPEVSFTTPDANISRKANHRIGHSVTLSCGSLGV